MKGIYSIWCFLVVLLLAGCVENDLPYPTIEGIIEEFAVESQTSVKIDKASASVSVKVADTLDLQDLRVEKLVVTPGMTVVPDSVACKDFLHFPDTGLCRPIACLRRSIRG